MIRVVAADLGMTPAQLRRQVASGKTMRQIALAHGKTLRQLRHEVLGQLRAGIGKLLR